MMQHDIPDMIRGLRRIPSHLPASFPWAAILLATVVVLAEPLVERFRSPVSGHDQDVSTAGAHQFGITSDWMVSSISYCLKSTGKAHAFSRRIPRPPVRRAARRVARRRAYYRSVAPGRVPAGTTVRVLPPSCSPRTVSGTTYYYCGGTFYRRAYNGPELVYVVVPSPYR